MVQAAKRVKPERVPGDEPDFLKAKRDADLADYRGAPIGPIPDQPEDTLPEVGAWND